MKNIKAVLLTISLLFVCVISYSMDSFIEKIEHGGRTRSFKIVLPEKNVPSRKYPLIIVLHGGGGNAKNAEKMSGMSERAVKEGFIIAYPNGTGFFSERLLTWNSGNCCGYALDKKTDDVSFIRAVINRLTEKHAADPSRVYVTGMSNGAMMTYALACELPGMITAIAPVSGAMNWKPCNPGRPLSVMIFHGTDDLHVLYGGGRPKKRADRKHDRIDESVKSAVDFWVERNGCSKKPVIESRGKVTVETYREGKDGTEVVLYTIKGGGHSWPGGKKGFIFGDEPVRDISATDLMIDFFKKHPGKK